MKQVAAFLAVVCISITSLAQKYSTKNAVITFKSDAKLEKIEAKSNTATSVILPAGDVAFSVLIKSFKFRQSLMEQHFNENYMESSKAGMDKSTFKGKMEDVSKVNFTKDGTYKVSVKGDLAVHGVKKSVTAPATITIKDGKLSATCTFSIKLKDYKISVGDKTDNISETVSITVSGDYTKN